MRRLLVEIEDWLRANRPVYWSSLNPPAHEYLFDTLRTTTGIVLPQPLRGFYEWHDGQKGGTFEPLLLNLTFMSLMEVATTHQMHFHVSVVDRWEERYWRPSWIPFLSNGGGDYLCIATESFEGIPAGAIVWFDHEVSDREIVHKGFDEFLEDLHSRMQTGRLEC